MSKGSIFRKIRLSAISIFSISLLLPISFPQAASASQAVIGWNADSGQVAGYDVHYGTTSGNYTSTLNAGDATTATMQNLSSQSYYLAVSAYDSNNNQSSLSSELVIDSLSASAGSGGSISPSGNLFQTRGSSQSFSIIPASGYVISNVQVDGTSVGAVASYTFPNISASHTITATFSTAPTNISYTISATPGANGVISPSGSVSVRSGGSQTFTITPTPGYSIAGVLVDGASVGATAGYTFSNVTANHTISASFVADTPTNYSISASAGPNGSISPAGTVSVGAGANQTFSINPAAGFQISSVLVDGTSIGASGGYTFYKVSANHTISASFTAAAQGPVADAGPNQTVGEDNAATLSALNTTDVGGPGLASYHWVQTSGQTVSIGSPNAITTGFKTPDSTGEFGFQLTATDKNGVSSTSTCIVNSSYYYTTAPTANAGPNQTVGEGAATELNGTASQGPSNYSYDYLKSYYWQQLDGPKVTLSNPASSTPTFTAPRTANGYASLCFMLTVTDRLGLEATDFCFVNVNPAASAASAPKAAVGPEQSVSSGQYVKLNGSTSTAASGIASYRWRQAGGIPVQLSDPTSPTPSFKAAKYSGTYSNVLSFTLTVTDKNGLRSKATELVVVR